MVRRIVTERQVALLLDLLEEDRNLAVGRLAGMPLGQVDVANRWAGIAEALNSLGEGASKSGTEWKTYWHELKYKTRKRALEVKRHASGTGGGRSKKPLTELELRIVSLIGEVAIFGIEEVRLPFNDPLQPTAASIPAPVSAAPAQAAPAPLLVPAAQEPVPAPAPALAAPVPADPLQVPADPLQVPADPLQVPAAPGPAPAQLDPPLSDESDPASMAVPSGSASTAGRARVRRDRHAAGAETRRRYLRRVSAGPPQWAIEFEERRLEVDARAAQALQTIAETLGRIAEELRYLRNRPA